MAKKSKKSKQQKRQAASERQRERRAAQQSEQARQPEIPTGPLSPGDRMNLMIDDFSRRLDGNPFAARAVACVVDYLLCGVVAMIPLVMAFNGAGGASLTNVSDLAKQGFDTLAVACVLAACLLASYAYYVLIPLKLLPGKTPGKYLCHLEIVMLDGTPATLGALSLRWAFMTFAETMLTFASALVIQFITLVGPNMAGDIYTFVGGGVSLISAWLVWTRKPDRRALHDLVAGTWVYSEASAPRRKGKRSKASNGR